MPARMDEILEIASRYGIPVIEDAAEALGSEYKGKKCGTLGKYGALSVNGNKIITTSGGGAVICPDSEAAKRVLFYVTQARENRPYYYHEHIGFNYRMSNISAGIGCGQMDVLAEHVERRRAIHRLYSEAFKGSDRITVHENPTDDFNSNFWLTTVLIDDADPEQLRQAMNSRNIETRWLWRPMHMQPVYADAPYYGGNTAESLFSRGLCLPSGSNLTDSDIERVVTTLKSVLK